VSPDALEKMKKNYDAVFIGCGHGRGMSMKVPGEDLKEVSEGLDFSGKSGRVRRLPVGVCRPSSAAATRPIDVARSVVRLGGKALLLYRRRRQDMPALELEVEMALEEGVELQELVAPAAGCPGRGSGRPDPAGDENCRGRGRARGG